MEADQARVAGTVALVGGGLAVLGALWPSDWVFLVAMAATSTLAWVVWQLGRNLHADRDPWREAGGMIAAAGLTFAAFGFLVSFVASQLGRPDVVLTSLSTAVSAGLYVALPLGLVLLGSRALRWEQVSWIGRVLPLAMGVCGAVAIPATVLVGLPGYVPGRFATLLVLLREIVLLGWIPLGIALRRTQPPDGR